MASACAGSLALFDAGVPLKAPVAGVSIGLITDESLAMKFGAEADTSATENSNINNISAQKQYVLLKDILGSEDHHGDMDYKIAGSDRGITAIQLDVKIPGGVPLYILDDALQVAKQGRSEILSNMQQAIAAPRLSVRDNAVKAEMVRYDADRRNMLVGPKGEMLKYMQELYQVTIDLDTEAMAYIYGTDAGNVAACSRLVQDIAILVKVGDTVSATIAQVMDYGVIVTINRAQQAILHISELSHDATLLKRPVNELVKVGQRLNVKVMTFFKQNKLFFFNCKIRNILICLNYYCFWCKYTKH